MQFDGSVTLILLLSKLGW